MKNLAVIAMSTAALSLVALNGGVAMARGGASSGAWPSGLPLPTSPGSVVAQSSTTAVARSTDPVAVVMAKLDILYVTQKGCTLRLAVNKPRDYFCRNAVTGKTEEVVFTFAAVDPTGADPSRSQTNAFYLKG